jgi:hypothetical protein
MAKATDTLSDFGDIYGMGTDDTWPRGSQRHVEHRSKTFTRPPAVPAAGEHVWMTDMTTGMGQVLVSFLYFGVAFFAGIAG